VVDGHDDAVHVEEGGRSLAGAGQLARGAPPLDLVVRVTGEGWAACV
jgi:hypothetical protein